MTSSERVRLDVNYRASCDQLLARAPTEGRVGLGIEVNRADHALIRRFGKLLEKSTTRQSGAARLNSTEYVFACQT
jgi:hypothetical protein